jgi:nucleoside-diphosphate-sugar epimerase
MSAETILITGAGGFVGGTIVEALHFGNEYRVLAGISRWSSAPRIARLPITLVQCDVLKQNELAEAFVGVDYVIHCAVGEREVIVQGTENVLNAAAKAGVKRVVHISSVAVYGAATGQIDEETKAPEKTLTTYGDAKVASEEVCKRARVDVVILRPSVIYGPFSAVWTVRNALRLKNGRWKHLGPLGEGKCNLVHVHDVVRFAIAAVRQGSTVGESFNINGPEIVTWNEYMERFNQHLGLPEITAQAAGRTHVKTGMMLPVRAIGKYALKHHAPQLTWLAHRSDKLQHLMQQVELTLKCTPDSDELSLFSLDAHYVPDKAERVFGFRSALGVDAGLTMSVAWLNHMGEPGV